MLGVVGKVTIKNLFHWQSDKDYICGYYCFFFYNKPNIFFSLHFVKTAVAVWFYHLKNKIEIVRQNNNSNTDRTKSGWAVNEYHFYHSNDCRAPNCHIIPIHWCWTWSTVLIHAGLNLTANIELWKKRMKFRTFEEISD